MPSPFNYTVSPNPNNDPADDAPVMRTNSQSIQDIILTDHVGFGNTKGGMHNQVTFAINQSAPGFATGKSDLFANTASGQSWPFWQNASGIFQMLGNASSAAANGYITIPTGTANPIKLQWGSVIQSFSSGSTTGTTSFNTNFLTGVFFVGGNPTYSNSNKPQSAASLNIRASSIGNTNNFDWQFYTNSGDYIGFTWFAVGV